MVAESGNETMRFDASRTDSEMNPAANCSIRHGVVLPKNYFL